ncbi:MAG: right-handed parallel beta-helix repeat-containing protein [Clostridia bacterium]|nr:right-handed parallel beta-helix repeat-containing protein [Clostridia bacterium]
MKKQNTRRAMLLSALSLLLCVSMLVGTTFAWFTDSVTSAGNIIKAGNLEVAMNWADGTKAVPADSSADWKDASKGAIFDYALWEPGYTEVRHIQIKNIGSLALKYQLTIESDEAIGELANVIDVYYADPAEQMDDRADLVEGKKLGTLADLLKGFSSSATGSLVSGAAHTVTLALKMQEEAGNEYQGKSIGGSFRVKLFATQLSYETDSFDQYYDESAAVFTVADANALLEKNKDVNLVNCHEPDGILYVPFGYSGTLVLNNVSIASVQESAAATTLAEETATAASGKIVILGKVDVKATREGMSAITGTNLALEGNGTLTAIAKGTAAFGIGGMTTKSISIKGITIEEVVGGQAGLEGSDTKYYKDAPEGGAAIGTGFNGGTISLEKVTVKSAIGGSKAAAIGARYHVGVSISIVDSKIEKAEGGVTAAAIGSSRVSGDASENGTTISIQNSVVKAIGGVYGAGIGSGYDTHCLKKQPLCTIQIADSDIDAVGGKYAAGVGTGYHNAALAGEIKNSTVKAVSGEKFYKNSYTAAMDVGFGVVDPTREGVQTESKLIFNGKAITLAGAPDAVQPGDSLSDALKNNDSVYLKSGSYTLSSLSGLAGKTIEGAADGSTKVAGVNSFNFGENTTLKNLTFTSSGGHSVRYATTSGDVVYENCVFEGRQYGYHVDNANGGTVTFNNCTFYGRNALAGSGTYFFNNCTFKYTYSNYNTTNIYSVATFNNCTWDSKLELYIASGAKAVVDGDEITQRVCFISDARALESFQFAVNGGDSYANVVVMLSADIDMKDAYYGVWYPVGQTGATQFQGTFDGHGHTIKNLNIDSSKQTGAHYSSGLFGWLNNATVKNLTVENATVIGNHNVGVIAGYMETSGCTISNCHVIGATVVGKHANGDACGDKVGVIVGHAGNAGVKVENCTATNCTVTAGRDAGQIVGAALSANVSGCTAENVTVSAGGDCTGANVNNDVIGRVL